jgi:hypothetical protein
MICNSTCLQWSIVGLSETMQDWLLGNIEFRVYGVYLGFSQFVIRNLIFPALEKQ